MWMTQTSWEGLYWGHGVKITAAVTATISRVPTTCQAQSCFCPAWRADTGLPFLLRNYLKIRDLMWLTQGHTGYRAGIVTLCSNGSPPDSATPAWILLPLISGSRTLSPLSAQRARGLEGPPGLQEKKLMPLAASFRAWGSRILPLPSLPPSRGSLCRFMWDRESG